VDYNRGPPMDNVIEINTSDEEDDHCIIERGPVVGTGPSPSKKTKQTKSKLFPFGVPSPMNMHIPFHPLSRFISRDECHIANLNQMTENIQTLTQHLSVLRQELERNWNDYERDVIMYTRRGMEIERGEATPPTRQTTEAYVANLRRECTRSQERIMRDRQNFGFEINLTEMSIRDLTRTLRGVQMGMEYMRVHPRSMFVIYFTAGDRDPVVQSVQEPQNDPNHPRDKRSNTDTNQLNSFDITRPVEEIITVNSIEDFYFEISQPMLENRYRLIAIKDMQEKKETDKLTTETLILAKVLDLLTNTIHGYFPSFWYTTRLEELVGAHNNFHDRALDPTYNYYDRERAIEKMIDILSSQLNDKLEWWHDPAEAIRMLTASYKSQTNYIRKKMT